MTWKKYWRGLGPCGLRQRVTPAAAEGDEVGVARLLVAESRALLLRSLAAQNDSFKNANEYRITIKLEKLKVPNCRNSPKLTINKSVTRS